MAMFRPGLAETPEEELQRRGSVMAPPKSTAQALVDFFFGSTPAERLANFGTMGMGAVVPKTAAAAKRLPQALEAFATPFRRAIEMVGSRARTKGGYGTILQEQQPLKDVGLYAHKNFAEAVQDVLGRTPKLEEALGHPFPSSSKGVAVLPSEMYRQKFDPFVLVGESPGVVEHELTHVGFPRLRESTGGVLERSFGKRLPELADEAFWKGEFTPALRHYMEVIDEAISDPYGTIFDLEDRTLAVNEMLARFAQGIFTPKGPERHLFSPVGRALAESRFPRIPDLPRP